jgi:lysozyme
MTTPPSPSPSSPPQFLAGIDVSHFQGAVRWPAVAGAGIAFAFAKASEGVTGTDPAFAVNWTGMKAAAIPRGAYHFFHPATSAAAQADHFLQVVGALAPGDLPPMLDLEETMTSPEEWDTVAAGGRVALVLTWLERVEAALGLRPILYTRSGFVEQYLPDPGTLTSYRIWVAQYTSAPAPIVPTGWPDWILWQYSQTGRVSGIKGAVDLDRFNGTLDELRALALPAPSSRAAPSPA